VLRCAAVADLFGKISILIWQIIIHNIFIIFEINYDAVLSKRPNNHMFITEISHNLQHII